MPLLQRPWPCPWQRPCAPRRQGRAASGIVLAAGLSLVAAGCSQAGDGPSPTGSTSSPIRGAAELTGFATTVPPAADFVAQSRKGEPEYMPVGITPPARSLKARSPQEVKALEAELDNTLRQHNAASGRKPTGDVYKSAAAEAKPAPTPRGADKFVIPPRPKPQDTKPVRQKPAPTPQ